MISIKLKNLMSYTLSVFKFLLKKKKLRNKKEEFILKINQLHINREFSKNLEIELSNQT